MSDRIDHTARAYGVLRSVGSVSMAPDEATVSVIAAQTHATLALVEQQRIANLIALASMAEDDSKHEVLAGVLGNEAVWTLATTKTDGLDNEFEIVNPDIAAALGIEVAP